MSLYIIQIACRQYVGTHYLYVMAQAGFVFAPKIWPTSEFLLNCALDNSYKDTT